MRSCEKKSGLNCRVPCFLVKIAGVVLIAVGLLLALIFIPLWLWLVILGAALVAVGIMLFRTA